MASTPKPVRKQMKAAMADAKREHKQLAKKLSPDTASKYVNKESTKKYQKESAKVVKELGMMRKRK